MRKISGTLVVTGGWVAEREDYWCVTVISEAEEISAHGTTLSGTMEILGGKLLETIMQREGEE